METGNENEKMINEETKPIEAEVVYEDRSDKKNEVKKDVVSKSSEKSNWLSKNFKYIALFVLGFVVAIIFIFCFREVMLKSSSVEVDLHDNGINLGIKNIYDATVYIENYKD